jgi:hypothetical protein
MAGLVPAIPIRKGETLHANEITGTRPAMTWQVVSSPASGAREGDPLPRSALSIPFPFADAPAGNDTAGAPRRTIL